MRWYTKFIVAAIAAAALFASVTASASARNISLTNRNIRVVFNPYIFIPSFGANVSCRLTLEGSFHCATISKVREALVGYISRATIDQPLCIDSGTTGVLVEVIQATLPWHIRYVSFIGTLPRVYLRIRLIRIGIRLLNVPLLGSCNYTGSPDFLVSGPGAGEITEGNANLNGEEGTEQASETPFCPSKREHSAPAPVTVLGTLTGIRVRLT
jgi:hypothetical protein